jgi:dihydroneopterin aldolase
VVRVKRETVAETVALLEALRAEVSPASAERIERVRRDLEVALAKPKPLIVGFSSRGRRR